MPININDPKKLTNDVTINYNYKNIPISINQFENTIQTDGFIKIPYVSNETNPNVVTDYNNQKIQYKSNKLYIIKSQNILEDTQYDAELIVEHKSTTNDNTLYTCFLLKSNVSLEIPTNIDQLILDASNNGNNNSNPKNLSLENLIENNKNKKIVYYTSNNKKVIILTHPFVIQNSFDASFVNLTPKLFDINPTDYKIVNMKEFNKEGFEVKNNIIEGFTKNMYCQPVDMTDLSGGGITTEPELSIPLDGNYMKNASTNTIIKTAINFCSFVLVLGITYIVVPIVYNDYIIGLIDIANAKLKINRIRSIDLYICAVFIMMTFGLISRGVNENNQSSVVMGFFVGLFFIISFIIIQSKKITADWLRMTFHEVEPAIITNYYTNVSVSDDFFNFIYENFSILYSPITNLFLFFFIYSIIVSFFAFMGAFNEKGMLRTGGGHIYLLLFTVYLTILLQSIINRPSQ
jgi:hypothetical protein